MIVRRYTGNDLDQIHQTIRQEMGVDAVVVRTDERSAKGLFGLGRRQYEVTAVADDARPPVALAAVAAAAPEPFPDTLGSQLIELERLHYRGIRQAIRQLDERLEEVDARMHAATGNGDGIPLAKGCLGNVHDAWVSSLTRSMRARGMDGTPTVGDWRSTLAEQLPVAPGLPFGPADADVGPAVYVFVGPTGVGKTTTLAKIASRCVLDRRLKVGMVTLDTFRLGAIEQLREYAKLLGVELTVAFSASELRRHVAAFADRDVVLVDTPGRSQFDAAGIAEIQQALAELAHVEVLLHVTAGERASAAETIAQSYRSLRPTALVLTKVDEAVCCDGLTRLFAKTDGIPVAYLTDGQRVPEDLRAAEAGYLAELIIPLELAPSA